MAMKYLEDEKSGDQNNSTEYYAYDMGEEAAALRKMKNDKGVGPDNIPVEVWKSLGEDGERWLASLFQKIFEKERMPNEWRRSTLVPIFKQKGDIQECGNYRGIKLVSHTMKVWERVINAKIRSEVNIGEE